ncbi:hypothetical protein BH23BAC4_BH23BAC4_10030 [soil metagenome]
MDNPGDSSDGMVSTQPERNGAPRKGAAQEGRAFFYCDVASNRFPNLNIAPWPSPYSPSVPLVTASSL